MSVWILNRTRRLAFDILNKIRVISRKYLQVMIDGGDDSSIFIMDIIDQSGEDIMQFLRQDGR